MGRKLVITLVILCLSLWLIDRMTLVITDHMLKPACGEPLLGSIGAFIGWGSCGQGSEKYGVAVLFILMLLGKVVAMISGHFADRLESEEVKS